MSYPAENKDIRSKRFDGNRRENASMTTSLERRYHFLNTRISVRRLVVFVDDNTVLISFVTKLVISGLRLTSQLFIRL